ncbi:MAG: tyrosine-type recombinase/integrase [Enterocloster clostridioformis]
MPEFFRLLLSCGLRCSEARLLTVRDVDLHQGILTVRDSKNHNSRLVPMPGIHDTEAAQVCREVHPFPEPSGYFFPGYGGKPMTLGNIYKNFRRFLWKAGIPIPGTAPESMISDIQTPKISKPFSESSGFTGHTKQKRFGYFLI